DVLAISLELLRDPKLIHQICSKLVNLLGLRIRILLEELQPALVPYAAHCTVLVQNAVPSLIDAHTPLVNLYSRLPEERRQSLHLREDMVLDQLEFTQLREEGQRAF